MSNRIFELIKKYRDETMTLGFLVATFGFWIGSDIVTNVIGKDLILFVVSPLGLLLILFGYEIVHVKKPIRSLKIIFIYVVLICLFLALFVSISENYYRIILMWVFCAVNFIIRSYINKERAK